MGEHVVQVGAYLLLIILMILAVGYLASRLNRNGLPMQGHMRVVSSLSLGMKEKLVLVQVGEQQILLGVTAANISRIQAFDEPVVIPEQEGFGDFRRKLQEVMQHNQKS